MATPSWQFLPQQLLLLPVTLVLILATAAAQSFPYVEPQLMARPGCMDKCGNMSIPFPFGIGSGCFRDGFEILCDRSFDPPRVFLAGKGTIEEEGFSNDTGVPAYRRFSRLELASISLLWRQARVYAPISYFHSTGDTTGLLTKQFIHLVSTPFAVSMENGIIGVGWSTQPTVSYDPDQPTVSCQTTWTTQKDPPYDTTNGLCEQELPYDLGPTQYIELAVLYQGLQSAYALLVENYNPTYNFYMTDMYSNRTLLKTFPRGVAIKLDFAAGNTSCPAEGQPLPPDYACVSANSSCVSATRSPGYLCECSDGYQGNPYVPNGCQDIDECKFSHTCTRGLCKNRPGGYDCQCKFGMTSHPPSRSCETVFTKELKMIIGGIGTIILMVIIFFFVILPNKKRKMKELYEKNGGLTLEKASGIKLFKKGELKQILKKSNLIGKGCFGEVYRGLLDNKLVAIKKPINGSVLESDKFANEVIIQSRVIHKNIVRLIGCCLDVDAPMLVYEFISQGSLHDILHNKNNNVPLNLDTRLNIAAQSADGLAYMHSKAHTRILHGDVKPANILLDDNFVPKISDFGTSRLIARVKEHTGSVIRDMNYMDPVYLQEGLLTEKSDVYSFGAVILELISSRAINSDDNSTVKQFLEAQKEQNKVTELLDEEIAITEDLELLYSLAGIAVKCLSLDVDQRPTMMEIAEQLLLMCRSRNG